MNVCSRKILRERLLSRLASIYKNGYSTNLYITANTKGIPEDTGVEAGYPSISLYMASKSRAFLIKVVRRGVASEERRSHN